MSFRVLVIPEDPTYNGYILRSLIEKMMKEIGKPNSKVEVLTNPKLSGFEHACANLDNICKRYNHFDLLLFVPDRDGKPHRDRTLSQIVIQKQKEGFRFTAIAAIEEIETWLLAGHVSKLIRSWKSIRPDISVKENVFDPFLDEYGDEGPGHGRERLMKETLKNYKGLLTRCPELRELQTRIKELLEENE